MKEEWRDIEKYDGIYEVSNFGRVRSWKGPKSGGIAEKPRVLKTILDGWGYPFVNLYFDGCGYMEKVHPLVLGAFARKKPKGMECRHLDGNKANNNIKNLKWGTHSENMQDRKLHGTSNRGIRNGQSKLKESDVLKIKEMIRETKNGDIKIASLFGVSDCAIYDIRNGKSWGWLEVHCG